MDKTMVLYWELWNLKKKHVRLPKTKRLLKKLCKYIKVIEDLNIFKALELECPMEKLWYYTENYGIIPKTMELWFTMESNYERDQNKLGKIKIP